MAGRWPLGSEWSFAGLAGAGGCLLGLSALTTQRGPGTSSG